ncbi:O(6)-methylguanine-induced apoptosis 2 [Protopterus annectens]|uniref:O(6)-methylguanine-induced apoptosis 2 n=1 Tax=Protopterus annectens TaxID=7888 RepID=UPI001CFA7C8E|nr:O(6)-methylguanine-induced apoptosis 2 [Protopterus annectens]
MATDTIQSLNSDYRMLHAAEHGKLHKGNALCSSMVSVPSKYRTMFISDTEKRGFQSQMKRFRYESNQNENPGPGSYNVTHSPAESHSTSWSKKGTGSFASKASRVPRSRAIKTPAANTYNISTSILSRKDFSKGPSSVFHQPIAVKVENKKNWTPAPNQYEVSDEYCRRTNNASAQSSFLSKSRREVLPPAALKGPSPCHYRVKDSLTKCSSRTPVSCFRSTTARIQNDNLQATPGPGTYDPYQPTALMTKMIFPKIHYLSISAPAIPPPRTPPLPGPGQYDIVDYEGPPKHYMSSAVFVSNTSRWNADATGNSILGPGFYEPEKPGKQSFLYNSGNKWVPA